MLVYSLLFVQNDMGEKVEIVLRKQKLCKNGVAGSEKSP